MASDAELFKDKIEISLDGRQVFYLFFGGAVIASLVFVLGVMVGKRVESRSHLERSAATSAALDPLAALDQLSGGGAPMSYAATLAGGAAAPSAVDRTIADMEKNRAAAPAPAPVPVKPAAAPVVEEDADDQDDEEAAKKAAEKAAKEKAAAEKAAAEKAAKEKAAAEKAAAEKDAKARFTLQLSSFQDRGEAEAFLSRMKTSGYGAAVMTEAVVEGKGTYFRIRFGRYNTYEDAVAAKGKFEADQQIIAYVTRL